MKRILLAWLILSFSICHVTTQEAYAYNFGDFRSETLTAKAWEALAQNDIEGVLAYTNKCLELYSAQAKKMQSELKDYPKGEKADIFKFWALNDVSTGLFIQGEAYRKAGMAQEAKVAYEKIASEYKFGQAWDANGWFWKPAEAAQEKLAMLQSESNVDFGDYTSSYLTGQAWSALKGEDLEAVEAYTKKIMELYGSQAKEMQDSLTEYVWESKEKVFTYWALNDVGTALFIQGEAYKSAGKTEQAKAAYKKLIDDYFYAQCWDPNGWFWKPAEAAQEALEEIGEI